MNRLSVSRLLSAVAPTTRSTAAAALGVRRSSSPSTRTRTPCSQSSASSRAMYSSRSDISAETSGAGRFQFSLEKAKSESTPTPASIVPSITSRTAFIPERCPYGRGIMRSRAQRPFPSMMIATCRGTFSPRRSWARRSAEVGAAAVRGTVGRIPVSDFHDLGFLRLDQVVDAVDGVVVRLLEILLGVLLLVLGDAVHLLQRVARVRARVAHGDPAVLGHLVDDLHEVAPALLVQRRQRHPDDAALRRRIEAEIGLADRLLDDLHLALVDGRDEERARLGRGDRRDLVQRHLLAVHLDAHGVEHRRRRLAGAHGGELLPRALHGAVHRRARVLHDLRDGAHRTRVPTRSPRTAWAWR